MVEVEDLGGDERAVDYGPNGPAVIDLIARARRVTPAQARALAGAASWHWVPLALPGRGWFGAARSEALAVARVAGRAGAAAAAEADARRAALESPGGLAAARGWSWAESGLVVLTVGVLGVILAGTSGLVALALACGLVALAGGGVVLVYESSLVTRSRLQACTGAAALALVVRDLVDPATFNALSAPWGAVMHD